MSGYSFFPGLIDWCVWWLAYVIGAFAVRMRHLGVLAPLLTVEVPTGYDNRSEPLVTSFENDAIDGIGRAVTSRRAERNLVDPAWTALLEETAHLQLLVDRYPELARSDEEVERAFVEYDFVYTAVTTLTGRGPAARWTMHGDLARRFASRLRADVKLRTAVADLAQLPLDEFDARIAGALGNVGKLGQFPITDAIDILRPEPST